MRSASSSIRAAGAAAAVLAVSAMLVMPSAGAQSTPFTIDPAAPTPGSTFTVSGVGCIFDLEDGAGPQPGGVTVVLVDVEPEFLEDLFGHPDSVTAEVASDGSWTAELTLPSDVEPGQEMFLAAFCSGGSFFSQSGSFGVGLPSAPQRPTTTTTTSPSSGDQPAGRSSDAGGDDASSGGGLPEAAPPVRAVNGEPDHTG